MFTHAETGWWERVKARTRELEVGRKTESWKVQPFSQGRTNSQEEGLKRQAKVKGVREHDFLTTQEKDVTEDRMPLRTDQRKGCQSGAGRRQAPASLWAAGRRGESSPAHGAVLAAAGSRLSLSCDPQRPSAAGG